jgi:multiple sugar transport system substrate-binding protein
MKIGAALLLALLFIGACASDDDGGSNEDGQIVFQVSGDPEEIVVYESLVRSFENETGRKVKLVPVADKDDHLAKLTTAFTAGNPPDVFLVNFREYSQFVVRDALEPVGPSLEDAGVELADYYEQPREAFTFDGELQCMPQNISSLVVYVNLDLFEKAGVKLPEAGWSWEDFRSAAVALTADGVRGVGIEPSIIRLAPFVWSNGGDIVDDLDEPTRFTLDEPEAREALDFFVQLVREDQVIPTEKELLAAEDLESMFASGNLGMLLSSRRDTPQFREIAELNWDVAPLPLAEEPAGILHSDAYCVSRESDQVEAAIEFIQFTTGSTGQEITALGGRTVPSLKKVSRSGAFLSPTDPPAHSEVFLDGIDYIRRTPVIPTWPEIEDVAGEFLTRAFYEPGYTVDDAISDIEAQTTPLFEEGSSS